MALFLDKCKGIRIVVWKVFPTVIKTGISKIINCIYQDKLYPRLYRRSALFLRLVKKLLRMKLVLWNLDAGSFTPLPAEFSIFLAPPAWRSSATEPSLFLLSGLGFVRNRPDRSNNISIYFIAPEETEYSYDFISGSGLNKSKYRY